MNTAAIECVLPLTRDTPGERDRLGGKAWGLRCMLELGVPVPPAFVITTDACLRYQQDGRRLPHDVIDALPAAMAHLESALGRTFGHGEDPLLVSVRSGAAVSMPGMMDTVLNLGLTEGVQTALAARTGDPAFAADTARRFRAQFESIVGVPAPADPWEQLHSAIGAVFASWNSRRAKSYRATRGLGDSAGTAVTVQAMVFGNLDENSGTGVLFTRNPLTGDPQPFGEWLPRGQGEDVVSGTHDPLPFHALAEQLPDQHDQLMSLAAALEQAGRDVQDIEFTIESGRLWLLQTRSAKRSPQAAIRLAVTLAEEGLITRAEALSRISAEQVDAVLRPSIAPEARASAKVVATGRPACPGVVSGVVVLDTTAAEDRSDAGESVILARPTTDPEDVPAMSMVAAVLTELGGSTSHAAVVSRELGVPCIVGCGEGTLTALEGHLVTVDAASGEVFQGALPVMGPVDPDSDPSLTVLLDWSRNQSDVPPALATSLAGLGS